MPETSPASLLRITGLRATPPVIEESPTVNPDVMRRDRRYRRSLALADCLSALVALLLCANVFGADQLSLNVLWGLPLVVIACKLSGLYDRDELVIHKTTLDEAPALFQLSALYTLAVWMLDGVLLNGPLDKGQAVILLAALFVLGLVFRRVARSMAARAVEEERLLVIGDAASYARIEAKLEAASRAHAKLVGRMSLQRVSDVTADERPVDERTLAAMIRGLHAHRILVVPSQTNPQVTLDVIRATKALGVRVSILPHVFDVVGQSVVFDDLGGMTIMGVREFALGRSSQLVKRAFDLIGATLGLLLVAPVLAVVALLVKLGSPGPILFRQERIGRDGRPFRIYKFRSMVADAEAQKDELHALNEAVGLFKIAEDPRVTRVGRILRKTSLDELPQLLNVLRGEMSLVGPRPLIYSEDKTITGYDRRRLRLTPGMTGHWQIMGSSRVPMHEMVKLDYVYVTTWSLFEDVKILTRTIPYMLARRGM
ncbi:sugar transferase [Conexibacter woesei]|uniref:sugar transferase n=1 Tax=Conexibacter woesei TaxID=191495 RepID=UPI00040B4FE3|nr:sugar transferase [Conexibacter woesei]